MEKIKSCKDCGAIYTIKRIGKYDSPHNKRAKYIYENGIIVQRTCRCYGCNREKLRHKEVSSESRRNRRVMLSHTPKKYVVSTYSNMLGRIRGKRSGSERYLGLEILSRSDFYKWALADQKLKKMLDEWRSGGKQHKMLPSIDRIDNSKGYVLSNIQWITVSENSKKANKEGRSLSSGQATMIRELYFSEINRSAKKNERPFNMRWLAKCFNVTTSIISQVVYNYTYKDAKN